jgi:hypothetical protein
MLSTQLAIVAARVARQTRRRIAVRVTRMSAIDSVCLIKEKI